MRHSQLLFLKLRLLNNEKGNDQRSGIRARALTEFMQECDEAFLGCGVRSTHVCVKTLRCACVSQQKNNGMASRMGYFGIPTMPQKYLPNKQCKYFSNTYPMWSWIFFFTTMWPSKAVLAMNNEHQKSEILWFDPTINTSSTLRSTHSMYRSEWFGHRIPWPLSKGYFFSRPERIRAHFSQLFLS